MNNHDNAIAHCCAECGKEGGVSLKMCKSCLETKYCDAKCQKNHWLNHKAACKLRAAKIRDVALFKDDPPPKEDCPICYFCYDAVDVAGQHVRRDCACRGTDAGFVHLSCLTKYAAAKSKQAHDMIGFAMPWHTCPSCHQIYQNELAIDIATRFVPFVRRQYPDDTQRQVESLYVKLRALDSMFYRLQPRQKREFGVTANVLQSMIDRMKEKVSPLPRRYSEMEAYAYSVQGRIAFEEGTEESARRAVVHFEKDLKVREATGDTDGIVIAKTNIALAKSYYEVGTNEEVLKACQEVYELRVVELGEKHADTIHSGKSYAIDLQKADREEEARELLTKLLATSKQVFGSHHNTTKEIESQLE